MNGIILSAKSKLLSGLFLQYQYSYEVSIKYKLLLWEYIDRGTISSLHTPGLQISYAYVQLNHNDLQDGWPLYVRSSCVEHSTLEYIEPYFVYTTLNFSLTYKFTGEYCAYSASYYV